MKFSWFLALRYLKPKRTFISIITVISIAGVALGVGVLIVVIAVMAGFQKRIKDEWLKVEPPLYLHDDNRTFFGQAKPDKKGEVPLWRELLPKIKSFPGVEAASPYLQVQAMVQQAPPKNFEADDTVPVGALPPSEPPAPEVTPAPEDPPPAPEHSDGEGAKGPPGKPAVPGKPSHPAAKPATKPPAAAPAAKTPAVEPPAPKDAARTPPAPPTAAEKPADAAPAQAAPPPDADSPDDSSEEENPDEDDDRPYTGVVFIGVDIDDARLMQKHNLRFGELRDLRPRPQAEGEFDIGGLAVVLTENVVAKLYREELDERPQPGKTVYNVYGPDFLHSGLKVSRQESAARAKAAREQKRLKEGGSDAGGNSQKKNSPAEVKEQDYPLPEELTLSGFFSDDKQQSTGQASIAYVSLITAQRLAGAGQSVDGIFVDLADPYDAPAMAEKLEKSGILPPGWSTETWVQRHRQQFEAVENEIGMMYIVLGFISLVAAFCIMNTMITMAVQKRREIGMMRALGAKTSHIVSLFMTKGFIVGLFGTGVGYALGRLVLFFRNDLRTWINGQFGHQIFDSAIYGLNEIPAELRPMDQVLICGIAFVLCTLAAVPPAWMVGRMEPARALRNDR